MPMASGSVWSRMSIIRVGVSSILIAALFCGSGCGESPDGEYRQYSATNPSDSSKNDEDPDGRSVADKTADSNTADSNATKSDVENTDNGTVGDSQTKQETKGTPGGDSNNQNSLDTSNSPPETIDPVNVSKVELSNSEPMLTEKREIKLLIPEKDFQADADGVIRVSYDDIDLLKVLNMEPVPVNAVDYFPDWLNDLNGKRIRIRGFMFPPPRRTGIEFFQLARDNEICCFGKQAKIYDKFPVEMRKGVTTDYIFSRPFDVVGKFVIDPFEDDGKLYELFRIEDAIIIEK